MRRWLAVLLLVLLPLQFSWAAVANYCMHEAGAVTDHPGHHVHVWHGHAAQVADGSDDGKADGESMDVSGIDCGHCHGHCVGMLAVPLLVQPTAVGSAPPSPSFTPCAGHVPAQPERPQWACLA